MRRIGEHAVVIGGSIAGLLAARALMDAYERVTVLERDILPAGFEGRKAIPQGRHAHALLPHGQACLDALLPGFGEQLVAAGAPTCETLAETRFVVGGHRLARASTGTYSLLASRPFIEGHVRRRVRALPGVELIDGCDALGLTARPDGDRVTGVRILRRSDGSAEELLAADLVVAASGRAARLPAWLEGLGYASPAEEKLAIGVRYASRHLRLPDGALDPDKLVLIGAVPERPRTLFLFAQEGGRWILSLGGYGAAHRAPDDPDAFAAFAATIAPPDVLDAIAAAEPLDDIATHGFPASVRRRYERLRRFPGGLLVTGDAICSFNPTYGQGMTVAAAEAVALRECLERGERELARRFFRATSKPIDHAWQMSVGADLALPQVEGRRPLRVRAVNAYLRRLRARAEGDAVVAGAFSAAIGDARAAGEHAEPGDRRARAARAAAGAVGGARRRRAAVGAARRRRPHAAARGRARGCARGGRLPPRQPGLERRLGAAAGGCRTAPARGRVGRPGIRRGGRAGLPADRPGARRVRRPRARRARGRARSPRRARLRRPVGPRLGRGASGVVRLRGADLQRGAARLPLACARARLAHAAARRAVHGDHDARRLPPAAAARQPAAAAAAVPRPHVRGLRPRDPRRRAAALPLDPGPGAAGELLAGDLRPLDRPALVIWGRRDPYLGVQHAERERAAFPRAELMVLDRAGHWPFVHDPAAVAAAVTSFLDRNAAPVVPADRAAA